MEHMIWRRLLGGLMKGLVIFWHFDKQNLHFNQKSKPMESYEEKILKVIWTFHIC